MKRLLPALCALALALPALCAHAQTPPRPADKRPEVSYQKPTTIIFGQGDEVLGELQRPDETMVGVRGKATQGSLIKMRVSFVREMIKSAECL